MSIVETVIPAPTRFFRSYNEIPPEIRRYILDESGERRVKPCDSGEVFGVCKRVL